MLDNFINTEIDKKALARVQRMEAFYSGFDAEQLIKTVINQEFKNEVALFSSFGAHSALLIDMVAEVNPKTPILFLDTEKHFAKTYEYVEQITKKLCLKNVHFLKPDPKLVKNTDPNGELWSIQPNRCCWMRKVEPLQRAIKELGIKALITGRKRYQTSERNDMGYFQVDADGIFRINPLAFWDKDKIAKEFKFRQLPQHPLVAEGYKSIGCEPCTIPVGENGDERDGRWAHTADLYGEQKSECGIHLDEKTTSDWSV
ncbi:MAG: phosphoadenylyl-sulfate reductase [Alphaproteobacteria bacterium CG11_big_fil_rev_8_21_14_0_20_44_7]|nr:MAG: phosphoadenylyl-sulfate reductase [Alphaproteobacteria bacterium CG11_big_fil_rev_8_21_14_0_20_44_7]